MSINYFGNKLTEIINNQINEENIKEEEENNNNNNNLIIIKPKRQQKNVPFPIKCCICGYIASGYIFYNVMCCDGCKHFFRRCISANGLFKCKSDGNCEIMNVSIKCKSCRFDKCIIMGMNVQKLRGTQTKSLIEIQSLIEERLEELSKGKYINNN